MKPWLDTFFAKRLLDRFGGGDENFLTSLMRSARDGHLCLKAPPPDLPEGMIADGSDPFPQAPIIHSRGRYYLQRNWVYETHICHEIQRLSKKMEAEPPPLEGGPLLPAQAKAVEHAFRHQLTLLSGGPGTGKTFTAGHLIRYLVQASPVKRLYKVCLTAPTGKAAQHLQTSFQSQGIQADVRTDTLHRLLGLFPGKSRLFTGQVIDADLVIVDEASMIDVDLWAHLLEAIGPDTRLVLMGDPDQLPPIEAGSIFADLTEFCGIRLERCMRTEEKDLQELGRAIQQGNLEELSKILERGIGAPFQYDPEALYREISPPLDQEPLDPLASLKYYSRFRILGALRQGPLGIDALNEAILTLYTRQMRKGDFWAVPILISSNDARLGLYNGSCGILTGAFRGTFRPKEGVAYFLDPIEGVRSFNPSSLPHFEWAFCLSIHKSQGSEFEKVFALFPPGSERFGREALYTAATRAKKSLRISIDPSLLREMVSQRSRKMSGILDRLIVLNSSK